MENIIMTKICTKCLKEKELSFFHKRKASKDGLCFICKDCYSIIGKTRDKNKLRESHRIYRESNPIKFMVWNAKKRSKKYNLAFNITIDDIIIPKKCPYLDIELTNYQGSGRQDSNVSLDRIIPELGYVKGNIEVISELANRMKNNATKEQLIEFSKNILKRYNK
jgi:hypothetical protein